MSPKYNKIVVASDSFKGSLTSLQVAQSVEKAVNEVCPSCEVIKVNVADGGEGTMEALHQILGGRKETVEVADPLGRPVMASYVIMEDKKTAVLEMSAASGLTLLAPEERDPSKTSTIGTGELIRDALDKGCRRFLIGIGGSATNDAGMGMLHALGYRFLDACGAELNPVGASMICVESIDVSSRHQALYEAEFIVACDVRSPLYGPDGASHIFAPQKGADKDMVEALDNGLRHFAEASRAAMGYDHAYMEGSGAAGGLGFAFMQFLGARLEMGVDVVLDAIHFDHLIEDADLVITGEGRIDSQTLTGKTPYGVARRAARYGIPVIVLAGQVDSSASGLSDFQQLIQVTPSGMSLDKAMNPETASQNIYDAIISLLNN